MKQLLTIVAMLFVTETFAANRQEYSPFVDKVIEKIDTLEDKVVVLEALPGAASYDVSAGILNYRIAKGRLNCAVSSDCSIGNHSMGVSLPANAVIVKGFAHINSRFVDSGPGSLQISCEDTGNILASGDITGALKDTVISAVSSGDVSVMKSAIAAPCVVTAAVGGAQPSSGDMSLVLEYFTHP